MKTVNCQGSGSYNQQVESSRYTRCSYCGKTFLKEPKYNPRIGGEILPGWWTKVPSHKEQ